MVPRRGPQTAGWPCAAEVVCPARGRRRQHVPSGATSVRMSPTSLLCPPIGPGSFVPPAEHRGAAGLQHRWPGDAEALRRPAAYPGRQGGQRLSTIRACCWGRSWVQPGGVGWGGGEGGRGPGHVMLVWRFTRGLLHAGRWGGASIANSLEGTCAVPVLHGCHCVYYLLATLIPPPPPSPLSTLVAPARRSAAAWLAGAHGRRASSCPRLR